jgi:hypothetical protein
VGDLVGDLVKSTSFPVEAGILMPEPPAKVTAAIANPLPTINELVPKLIDVWARMVPTNLLSNPMVALVPKNIVKIYNTIGYNSLSLFQVPSIGNFKLKFKLK